MPFKSKDDYNAYMNNYMKQRWVKRRLSAIRSLGGACHKCGNTNVDDLDFDHIDPSTKTMAVAEASSLSNERFQEEVSKCQLLCRATCHLEKSVDEGSLGDKVTLSTCSCGRSFESIKSFAGHRRWCQG